jgi:hypothetical protein
MNRTNVPIGYSNIKLTENKMKKNPTGFANVAKSIAKKEGLSKGSAAAILASATRNASSSAKRKNPKLNRVK